MATRKLRYSPSGPIDGESIPAGNAIGDVPTWDGDEYLPVPGGGGGGGNIPWGGTFFVDPQTSLILADQNGAPGTPFATAQQAIVSGSFGQGDSVVIGAGAAGDLVLTTDTGTFYGLTSGAALDFANLWVRLGTITFTDPTPGNYVTGLVNINVTGLTDLNNEGYLLAHECSLSQVTGVIFCELRNCEVLGTLTVQSLSATNVFFGGNISIEFSNTPLVSCRFDGAIVITFTGAPGVLTVDENTLQNMDANGVTVVNGTITVNRGLTATISVIIPAIVAGVLEYVDVSTVGTRLEGITPADNVHGSPTVDLVAAGATNGFYINCRVSAINTIRIAFVGTLAGGATDFIFTIL